MALSIVTAARNATWQEWIALPFLTSGAISIVVALGTVAWQCYFWLRRGVWQPLAIREVLEPCCSTGWIGADKLINLALDYTPLSLAVFAVGRGIMWIGVSCEQRTRPRRPVSPLRGCSQS